ncbi:MAG: DNA-processing protein DprA [bacterium]
MHPFIEKGDREYPEKLSQIKWPPPILFYEGDLKLLKNEENIAVVGTRKVTEYGAQATRKFVTTLVKRGFVIVSGMARGVDGIAHETCLRSGGKTIAVLAHGLDMTYPPEHEELRKRIVEQGGLVVSEYPDGQKLTKQHLALRNRIVVGLSKAVLVTESPKSSGTKITVGFAADQGKDVYVVPGPITYPTYIGSVEIIRDGGIPVSSPEDIQV